MLVALGDPPINFVLWNGEEIPQANGPIVVRVHAARSAGARKLVLHPDLDFGELYMPADSTWTATC